MSHQSVALSHQSVAREDVAAAEEGEGCEEGHICVLSGSEAPAELPGLAPTVSLEVLEVDILWPRWVFRFRRLLRALLFFEKQSSSAITFKAPLSGAGERPTRARLGARGSTRLARPTRPTCLFAQYRHDRTRERGLEFFFHTQRCHGACLLHIRNP